MHSAHADRAVVERTVLHADPSVLEAAGDAREAFEEVSVIQDTAAFAAFERDVLPGLRGSDDGVALRDHYPRGTFVVLDAAGHNLHLEQPEVTAALVRDRFARIDR
ncbi:alpha/beta fold hydrolase [Curtobacterium sp. ME12]|uniref:alpha/beta fold hydrolase n=1 Tax=Curtobacterium sp. ME12 TaxID=2744253 RepID=UPI0015F4D595|nr:hypothetical protein [Curtobacterium sp. ME12]